MTAKNKPKILFLVQLPPPIHGASLMNQFLVNSILLNEKFSKKVLNLDFVTNVSQIGKFSLGKILKMFKVSFVLFKTLLTSKFDLVYFTLSPVGGAFYRDALFVFILKLFNSKIVYHLHGKGISEEVNNPFKKFVYKFVFHNVSVICLSELLNYDIKDVFKGDIYNVPNGIPVVSSTDSNKNLRDIIYLSSLKKSKGVLDFVESLHILNLKNIDFQAKIIGSSTNDLTVDELKKRIIDYGLEKKVRVLGPIYGDNKFKELASSGIFCFPTYYRNECFPLSILEAMMMGLIPVSTNNGAIEEIINHETNGMIVKMNNPVELANTLSELLSKSDEELIKLSYSAKIKFNTYYTIEIFESKIIDVFNKILVLND